MTAARKLDPVSSHKAAREVETRGIKRAQQIEALVLLKQYQDDPDAHAALVEGEIQRLKARLGRRLPELQAVGLVKCDEIRKCEIANRASQAWHLTTIGNAAAESYQEL